MELSAEQRPSGFWCLGIMKKSCLSILVFLFFGCNVFAQCTLELNSITLDTAASTCNHLFFKYQASGGTPTSFFWDYGDGNSCTCLHPKNVYNRNGTFQLCGRIKDANGCADSLCVTVNVFCPNPCTLSEIGIFSYDSLSYSCREYEFITITSQNAKKINWDFGDGDSANTKYTLHTFKSNGTFKVRLTIQDSIGCADTAEMMVGVNCPPDPQPCTFNISKLDTASGMDCKSKNFTLSANKTPKTVHWDFGDSSTWNGGKTTSHSYIDTGLYKVCAIATDSADCKDTMCQWVKVSCPSMHVSVNAHSIATLQLYPNPVVGTLTVLSSDVYIYAIYDAAMRKVASGYLREGTNTIDFTQLSSGVYTMQVQNSVLTTYYRVTRQ